MKGFTTLFTATLLIGAACTGDVYQQPAPQEIAQGLTIDSSEERYAAGTYVVADVGIRFESIIDGDREIVRFMDMDGNELFRSELEGDPETVSEQRRDDTKWGMWHYGVKGNPDVPMEEQAEVMAWLDSEEAQLAASMWRDLQADNLHEQGALNGLFRYGVHLDEAMAFDSDTAEQQQEAVCSCYGKCGPGCFSVGSNWYCRKHDCCCRTYGSWACYSWCFAYPKCPAPICR